MEAAAPPTDAAVQHSGADEMEATGSSSVAKPASKVVAPEPKVKPVVDREKQCPFLLRIFARNNSHHRCARRGRMGRQCAAYSRSSCFDRVEDFWYDRLPVEDELQIYTWCAGFLPLGAHWVRRMLTGRPFATGATLRSRSWPRW